jgi:hypothetical protein
MTPEPEMDTFPLNLKRDTTALPPAKDVSNLAKPEPACQPHL